MGFKQLLKRSTIAALLVLSAAGAAYAQPPAVQTLTPNSGSSAGGTDVKFNGARFTGTTAVSFGGAPAQSFAVVNDNELRAITPAHAVGQVNVQVTNGAGTTTASNAFTYRAEPVPADDAYSTMVDTTLVVAAPGVLANDTKGDGDNLTASIWTGPSRGGVTLNSNGSFTYTPVGGYAGPDSFTYRVSTTIGLGSGVGTVRITVAGIPTPQPPLAVTVWSISNSLVTLRWQPPTAGLTPTQYAAACGVNPGETLQVITTPDASTAVSFGVLGGVFHCRVFSRAGGQQSTASNEVRIANTSALAPSAPDSLTAVVNASTVALAWRHSFEGGLPGSVVLDVTGSAVTSLPLGTGESTSFAGAPAGTYTLTLRGTNSAGSSAASNAVTITVPSACAGAPPAPPNLLVYKIGNTIVVTWGPSPAGSPAATSYVVNVSGSFTGSVPTTGRSVSGSVGAGSYTFTVVASNVCGSSVPTAPQTISVP